MIRPVNFTGIKNVGYASVYTNTEGEEVNRNILNMQLTNDNKGNDLTEYRKLLAKHPSLINTVNDEFINVELETNGNDFYTLLKAKINGNIIPLSNETFPIIYFAKKLVDKVVNLKLKDFKSDPDHYLMKEAQEGLIYNEQIDDYLDGTSGQLGLLKGTGLTEKFDYYFNDENSSLSDGDAEKVFDAADDVVAVLHDPLYVHNGAIYLDALMSTFSQRRNKLS